MRTWCVTWEPGYDYHWYVSAPSRGAARYIVWRHFLSVSGRLKQDAPFGDFKVQPAAIDAGQDPYEYVRRTYGVPAFVGTTATYLGQPAEVIRPGVENSTCYVHIAIEGKKARFVLHPKDDGLEWLSPQEEGKDG